VIVLNSREDTARRDAEAADCALAASGDALAFQRLYEAHVARIHSLARRMIGDDLADEVTQDVFVRAWEKLGTFRGASAFGTWLYRLAINLILGRRAVVGRDRERLKDGDGIFDRMEGKTVPPELTIDFESAIGQLPDGARRVFVLHDVEGFKHREIASMLGVTEGTTKAQLHRARMALRQHLER
jgi:RNA polymerase sigma-70 factor (ECF subfamily)